MMPKYKHFLGNYGITREGYFFMRGGLSIDKIHRNHYIDWWPQEELPMRHMLDAINIYRRLKPTIVISHECPSSVVRQVATIPDQALMHRFGCLLPSNTAQCLHEMLMIHQPKQWYFGHYHIDKTFEHLGTEFTCLGELSYKDI